MEVSYMFRFVLSGIIALVFIFGVSILVSWALRKLLKRSLRGSQKGIPLPDTFLGDGVYFGFKFVQYHASILLTGACLGLIIYLTVGRWIRPDLEWSFLASKGIANGLFFLGMVWGPGLALVACFIHGRKQMKTEEPSA